MEIMAIGMVIIVLGVLLENWSSTPTASGSGEPSPTSIEQPDEPFPGLLLCVGGGSVAIIIVIVGLCGASETGDTSGANRATPTPSYSYSPSGPTRDDEIDAYVDRMVDQQWRPIPGGNSKEDAARVSKDIMKAQSWEELEHVIEFHSRNGR